MSFCLPGRPCGMGCAGAAGSLPLRRAAFHLAALLDTFCALERPSLSLCPRPRGQRPVVLGCSARSPPLKPGQRMPFHHVPWWFIFLKGG